MPKGGPCHVRTCLDCCEPVCRYQRRCEICRIARGRQLKYHPCPQCGFIRKSDRKSCERCRVRRRRMVPCPHCGREFWPWRNRASHARKTCGRVKCWGARLPKQVRPSKRMCGWCRRRRCAPRRTRYCSEICCARSARARRRLRRRGVRRGDVVSLAVLARRDRFRCGLCGKRVLMRKWKAYGDRPTLDHIVPLALGGLHVFDNCQLAHFRCNSRKRERSGCLSQLRLALADGSQSQSTLMGIS